MAKLGYSREVRQLTASWYSTESLKQEGTYKYSKGIMANGRVFNNDYTCATNLYPLGSILMVYRGDNKVSVEVTDRINKRFTKTRIDLSQKAFSELADCKVGIIKVRVENMGVPL
jgi:rare lipoprotein A (peptidoglycan hydrolase)